MEIVDIRKRAFREVGTDGQDAFTEGALWAFSQLLESDDYIVDDILPKGSIKIGSLRERHYYILGPCLGILSQSEARRQANIGLWRLPDMETLKWLWKEYPEVFEELYEQGEEYLMSSDTWNNRGFINACMLNLKTGKEASCIPGNKPYPTRAIIEIYP